MPGVLAVVAFGLLASLIWGVADFGGGLAARRAPLLGVLVFGLAIGLVLAVPASVIRAEPPFAATFLTRDLWLCVLTGVLGTVGIAGLYGGLAVGRMGVVAPVAGVIAVVIPVVAGILLEGWPAAVVVAGIVLAIASVVLVSRIEDETSDRPSGIAWALVAGVGMGTFSLAISQVSDGLVFGPLVLARVVEIGIFVVIILVGRFAWRVPRAAWPLVAAVGLLDVVGNASYLGAVQSGPLAIAAVLSTFYPAVTAVLAVVVLRERVNRMHAIGIVAAGIAIAMIAGGSAA